MDSSNKNLYKMIGIAEGFAKKATSEQLVLQEGNLPVAPALARVRNQGKSPEVIQEKTAVQKVMPYIYS